MMDGINIQPIANGWVVRLMLGYRPMPFDTDEGLLDKIKSKAKEAIGKQTLIDAEKQKDVNVFYFETFEEVLTFLKSIVNDFSTHHPTPRR